ncbi:MarR family winged helix-turn-helix transcriptional regulator [Sinomicrobium weinanense]|uniref:Winged helix-turn-helix transcriptional regulator n=1 Tax=Sinomicrobium weinanense TaxID=2842200 RepID=A0A926JVR9_9FLAO|nr:MarR family winged helix-turn-helix transcriptional regulator [Sinomicrobium weinanense]MBC9798495.1 winged helix-turn-helix transcriptional regulator [Sinomicrobium weinanense]MBU3125242.1 MarR family winged helix-turn-helix transcriptional regulator [Sinomicrobium weinanense]
MKDSPFDPDFQHLSTAHKIVVALERISEAFRVLLWEESKSFGLSPTQIQILIFLNYHDEGKRKVSYIAREFNMTKATVSDSVKVLEQKKLITKEYLPHDTRSYIIHLSETGKAIAEKTALFTQEIQKPVQRLPPAHKEGLLRSLMDIIHHLNKSGVITIQRMCFSCRYYSGKGNAHYCNLLQTPLTDSELRVDCPEHELIEDN